MWDVWKVYYMTYEQIAALGDKPRERVTAELNFASAQAMVNRLDAERDALAPEPWFGHSMHPAS